MCAFVSGKKGTPGSRMRGRHTERKSTPETVASTSPSGRWIVGGILRRDSLEHQSPLEFRGTGKTCRTKRSPLRDGARTGLLHYEPTKKANDEEWTSHFSGTLSVPAEC